MYICINIYILNNFLGIVENLINEFNFDLKIIILQLDLDDGVWYSGIIVVLTIDQAHAYKEVQKCRRHVRLLSSETTVLYDQ